MNWPRLQQDVGELRARLKSVDDAGFGMGTHLERVVAIGLGVRIVDNSERIADSLEQIASALNVIADAVGKRVGS